MVIFDGKLAKASLLGEGWGEGVLEVFNRIWYQPLVQRKSHVSQRGQ
jgi:hypothetical protein